MKGFSLASLIILFSILILSTNALAISGLIDGEETWSGEVFLTGDVTVIGGGKLTILPGTVVKAQPDTDDQQGGVDPERIEIIVDGGELVASGTESEHITFTSGMEEAPITVTAEGRWYGTRLIRGALTLRYCNQSDGVIGLSVEGAVPQAVENCAFTGNSDKGALFKNSFKLVGCLKVTPPTVFTLKTAYGQRTVTSSSMVEMALREMAPQYSRSVQSPSTEALG